MDPRGHPVGRVPRVAPCLIVAEGEGKAEGEPAARALAADDDRGPRVLAGQPAVGSQDVAQRRGERVLGREPVVGDKRPAAGRLRQPPGERRGQLRRAHDVAAAVQVQDHRRPRARRGGSSRRPPDSQGWCPVTADSGGRPALAGRVQPGPHELGVAPALAEPARRPVLARQRRPPQVEGPPRLRPAQRIAGNGQVQRELRGCLPGGGDRVVREQPFLHGRAGGAEPR